MNPTQTANKVLASPKATKFLAGEGIEGRKLMVFGDVGSGKTYAFADLVTSGERLLVVTTEEGGGGMITLANELARRGNGELYRTNVFVVTLYEYKSVLEAFKMVTNKETGKKEPALYKYYPELREFAPTVLVWEGFTNFQTALADEEILGNDEMKIDAADGGRHGYWGELLKISRRILQDFQSCSDPDHPWDHVMTVHDAEDWEYVDNKKTKFLGLKPAVMGQAQKNLERAHDVILHLMKVEKKGPSGSSVNYLYEATKTRGHELPLGTFPADMKMVWAEMGRTLEATKKEETK